MEGKDFAAQALFTARMATHDGLGSATVSFRAYAEYLPEGVAPIKSEELAGLLRDFYSERGWVMTEFYGQLDDKPLDWPVPTEPEAP
jgi:hypothetical protein